MSIESISLFSSEDLVTMALVLVLALSFEDSSPGVSLQT
jgi:hypothetical protein